MQQAFAQGNEQARYLFEMQEMRQEIAELRDMIERQAFQIKQLQRGGQPGLPMERDTGTQSNSSVSTPVYGTQRPSYPQGPASAPEYPAPSNNPYSEPYSEPTQTGTVAGEYPSTVRVEQRTVASSNSQPNTGAYPPVEERTVGVPQTSQSVPVYDPETYNQPTSNQSGTISSSDTYNQQNPIGIPEPYQREEPIRQPIPNNIPTSTGSANTASSGVITIPPVSESNNQYQTAPNGAAGQAPLSAAMNEQGYYQQGFELLKKSQHNEAVDMFKQQISNYPSGEYADDAHYWIAESLYVNRDLDQSKLYFKAIIANFPQSSRLPDAMLKTAYIEQEQGNKIEARILLQEIIQFHPRSNAAISAKNRLADLD